MIEFLARVLGWTLLAPLIPILLTYWNVENAILDNDHGVQSGWTVPFFVVFAIVGLLGLVTLGNALPEF